VELSFPDDDTNGARPLLMIANATAAAAATAPVYGRALHESAF
jgi:hypothetical protein